MPFTIDAVAQWIVQRYRDQIGQRGLSATVGTSFFSLLHSLLHEHNDDCLRVIEALTYFGLSIRLVGLRQPDPTIGVCHVLGEMLAVKRLKARLAPLPPAQIEQ